MQFNNPRLHAEFNDWPLGGSKRGLCIFKVEPSKRGIRVSRTTTGKPKYTTYGGPCAIVDGADGKTYILKHAGNFHFISILRHDFMCPDPKDIGEPHTAHMGDPRFQELMELIRRATD